MILLDTNVISELMKESPARRVVAWLDRQPRLSIWTTSVTVYEIRFGLQIMARGKRRDMLSAAFDSALNQVLDRRIAVFDAQAAQLTADLMAERQRIGRPGDLRDAMIGGIALATNAGIATGNASHFEGLTIPVVDPFNA